jgi:RNA polymerase sigma factor (sigma-70 family)
LNAPDTGLVELALERAVVARLQAGDASALGELYGWYGDRIYRTVVLPRLPVRELAEDVLRDTFRVAIERIETYKEHDTSIFFWLRRIAINRAIDVYRAWQRRRRLEDAADEGLVVERSMAPHPPAPDRSLEGEETRALIEQALALVNPRYAQALRLRLLEDRDREECAAIMEVTVGNFDVILHRATKAFRSIYPP